VNHDMTVLDGVPYRVARVLGTMLGVPWAHYWWWNGTAWQKSASPVPHSAVVTHNGTVWGVGVDPSVFPRRPRMVDLLGAQPSRGLGGYQPFMTQPCFAPGDDLVVNIPTAHGPAVLQTGHRAPLIVAVA
jgi:hypothetical protein